MFWAILEFAFMFAVSLELEFSNTGKDMVRHAMILAATAFTIPFFLGMLAGYVYFDILKGADSQRMACCFFCGSALAITAFPVLARILQENKLIKSKLGSMAMISAGIQDAASWVLLSYECYSIQFWKYTVHLT